MKVKSFLENERVIRKKPYYSHEEPYLHFKVECIEGIQISIPFMLEQALICLLENAVRVTLNDESYQYQSIEIKCNKDNKKLSVSFTGSSISETLSNELNASLALKENEFINKINGLLEGRVENRPEIGIVEAWCIAYKCYGGMECSVDSKGKKTTFSVNLRPVH